MRPSLTSLLKEGRYDELVRLLDETGQRTGILRELEELADLDSNTEQTEVTQGSAEDPSYSELDSHTEELLSRQLSAALRVKRGESVGFRTAAVVCLATAALAYVVVLCFPGVLPARQEKAQSFLAAAREALDGRIDVLIGTMLFCCWRLTASRGWPKACPVNDLGMVLLQITNRSRGRCVD